MPHVFQLDPRLDSDCFQLGEKNGCLVLLMNNALVPWFIIVPETDITELYQLPGRLRSAVDQHVDALSGLLLNEFAVTKLNIAAIGNVVSQLHIHVVGRHPGDFCWPGVVWGRSEREPYSKERVEEIAGITRTELGLVQKDQ